MPFITLTHQQDQIFKSETRIKVQFTAPDQAGMKVKPAAEADLHSWVGDISVTLSLVNSGGRI